jgi:tetratricopeptide (TPR) repeat protein
LLGGLVLLAYARVGPWGQEAKAPPEDVMASFRAAQGDMQAGRFDRAIGRFQEVLERQPDLVEARVNLGLAYHALGDYNRAAAELSWAARQRPDILPAQLFLGLSYLKLGFPEKAIVPLKRALAIDPWQPEARWALAHAELWVGQYGPATQQFRRLAGAQKDPSEGWFTLGKDYLQMAAQLGSVPPSPTQEFLLAALLRVAGDSAGAERERARFASEVKSGAVLGSKSPQPSGAACAAHQERLCAEFLGAEKSPSFADRLTLGRTLLALRQDEAATDDLAAALAQNKTSPEARYWLNQGYRRLAGECFNHLAAAYPDSWRAHELKAEAARLRQSDKEARAEYEAAARLNPGDPGIHEALGELLLQGNAPEEGKSELETALRLDPSAPRSLYLLGSFYVSQREPEKGIPYLEAALRYDPALLEARPVLGKAYLNVGKAELAAELNQPRGIEIGSNCPKRGIVDSRQ